jgi:hypothetical protein
MPIPAVGADDARSDAAMSTNTVPLLPTVTPVAAERLQSVLLTCGILSSLCYVTADRLGAIRWPGYSYTSQAISELMAIDAPSRALVVPLFLAFGLLTIAFGVGVSRAAGRKRALRVTGVLLIAMGVLDLGGPFFPMHLRGVEATFTDTMHVALTSVLVLLILLAIGFGAAAFGKWFRRYSIATLVMLAVFGTLAGLDGPRLAARRPTPWLGITERIDVYGYLQWVALLAIVLLTGNRLLRTPKASQLLGGHRNVAT